MNTLPRVVSPAPEADMVSLFLRSEFHSTRWNRVILEMLRKENLSTNLIDTPNTADEQENRLRSRILGSYRGYGRNREMFENFPTDMVWQWIEFDRQFLSTIKYIDYSYWNKLSNGSRSPSDAARNIRKGVEVYSVSNAPFLEAAEAVRQGEVFPEMILVSKDLSSEVVVVEGHQRLTAYILAGQKAPDSYRALVGLSPSIAEWGCY